MSQCKSLLNTTIDSDQEQPHNFALNTKFGAKMTEESLDDTKSEGSEIDECDVPLRSMGLDFV